MLGQAEQVLTRVNEALFIHLLFKGKWREKLMLICQESRANVFQTERKKGNLAMTTCSD